MHSFISFYDCSIPSVVLGKAKNQDLPSGAHRLVNKTDIRTNNSNSLINAEKKERKHWGLWVPQRGETDSA